MVTKHGLGETQAKALRLADTQRVSSTQGPPGTGKTRTATALIDAMHEKKGIKILVSSATNDGIDNIGSLCVDAGMHVGRVGFRDNVSEQFRARMAARCFFEEIEASMTANHHPNKNWNATRRTKLEEKWKTTPIMCATNVKSAEPPVVSAMYHNMVILEESCMSIVPFSLIPIVQCSPGGRISHFGDHKQLPPACNSTWAAENGLNVSLMESLQKLTGIESCFLDVQHRMHSSIRKWPSYYFYGDQFKDSSEALKRRRIDNIGWLGNQAISFMNVDGIEHGSGDGSLRNVEEADALVSFLDALLAPPLRTGHGRSLKLTDIGVITPYSAQVKEIRDRLEKKIPGSKEIIVGSVEKFQGNEKELILMSTVRCNVTNAIGFLKEERRLNVAITRARRGILIFGNVRTLYFGSKKGAWASFLERAATERFLFQLRRAYKKAKERLMLDHHDAIPLTTVTADRGQGVSSAQAPSEQSPMQNLIKALRMLQQSKETDTALQEFQREILHESHSFMQGSVKHLVQLLMHLPAHRYNASDKPEDPLKWGQKAISHESEVDRADEPRDIENTSFSVFFM